jgi:hypothetical protein
VDGSRGKWLQLRIEILKTKQDRGTDSLSDRATTDVRLDAGPMKA